MAVAAVLVALALPLLSSCTGGNDGIPSVGLVQGTVLDDQTSLPIAGATVSVAGISATSTASGSFSIPRVPAGARTYSVAATGYLALSERPLEVPSNGVARVDARLAPGSDETGTVHGRVTHAVTRAPIAMVAVRAGSQAVVTDEEGIYSLVGLASGSATVTFSKAGFVERSEALTVTGGASYERNVSLEPKTTGAVAGTVTSSVTGAALSGATVSIESLGSTTSGADGSYLLDELPAGVHTVRFARSGYRTVERAVTVTASQTTTQDVALAPPVLGSLEGQVRNARSGGLQAGVHVTVVELDRAADTDANGYYSIASVPSGVYTVLFSLTDYGSTSRSAVAVEGGETTVVDIELAPTVGGLVGWVWERDSSDDGHGSAIADATVRIGNDLTVRTTDSAGHYEAHDIPAAENGTLYTVYAWSETHDLSHVDVVVRPGQVVQVPDIVLGRAQ